MALLHAGGRPTRGQVFARSSPRALFHLQSISCDIMCIFFHWQDAILGKVLFEPISGECQFIRERREAHQTTYQELPITQ